VGGHCFALFHTHTLAAPVAFCHFASRFEDASKWAVDAFRTFTLTRSLRLLHSVASGCILNWRQDQYSQSRFLSYSGLCKAHGTPRNIQAPAAPDMCDDSDSLVSTCRRYRFVAKSMGTFCKCPLEKMSKLRPGVCNWEGFVCRVI
jgi:hypothetical protein